MKSLKPPRTTIALLIVIGLAVCFGFVSGAFFHRNQPFPYRYFAALVPDQQGVRPEYDHRATLRCIDKISDSSTKPVARVLVVGHAYATPGGNNRGVAKRLVEFLASSGDHWDLMALTGDMVRNATRHNLLLARDQLSPYTEQLAIAPGTVELWSRLQPWRECPHRAMIDKRDSGAMQLHRTECFLSRPFIVIK